MRNGPSADIKSASALILDLPASRIVTNTLLSFISYPVEGVLLEQPRWTKTTPNRLLSPGGAVAEGVASYHHGSFQRSLRWLFLNTP